MKKIRKRNYVKAIREKMKEKLTRYAEKSSKSTRSISTSKSLKSGKSKVYQQVDMKV